MKTTRQAGFQLLDAMLTCLLIALLLAATLPFLTGLAEEQRRAAACHVLVSTLSKARALSVSENLAVRLIAEPSGRFALQAVGDRRPLAWRRLPGGVRFERLPRRPVTFHPRGTASPAGTYHRAESGATLKVVVAVSGRIRWSRK